MVWQVLLPVLLAALWLVCYWAPRRRLWRLAATMPGPPAYPLVGNAGLFWGTLRETFVNYCKVHKEYGRVVRLWFGTKLTVLLTDPEDIKQVLGNTRIRARDANISAAMVPFFGDGLMSNSGDLWQTHRKIVTPMFHFNVLDSYVDIFGAKAKTLIVKLSEIPRGKTFDAYLYLSLCTLDAICETVIGSVMDTQTEGHSCFQESLHDATTLVHNRVIKPWLLHAWLYPWTSDGRRAKPIIERIHQFSDTVIENKMADYRRGVRRQSVVTASGKAITSILDMFIEASESQGYRLSNKEIQDELTSLAAGGLETTATTIANFLILIAIHPEVQKKVHEELDSIFDGDDRCATTEDIHRMVYTDLVLKETLRHFPVIALLAREITEDIKLNSGYTLPAGCSTMTFAYLVHRDEKHFPDPHKFLPERWLNDNPGERHPYSYLPFSAGSRNCVGQKYAMLQMKSIISQVLRKFTAHTEYNMADLNDLELSISITLGPGNYKLSLQDRMVTSEGQALG